MAPVVISFSGEGEVSGGATDRVLSIPCMRFENAIYAYLGTVAIVCGVTGLEFSCGQSTFPEPKIRGYDSNLNKPRARALNDVGAVLSELTALYFT